MEQVVPVVAHFCSTFLKPDMQHLYRQITGLQAAEEFESIVVTRSRENVDAFWYWPKKVRTIPKHPLRFFRRFWHRRLKGKSAVPLSFREARDILYELKRTRADLLHVYFGHVAVELLPVLRCCRLPVVISFHGADAGVDVDGESGAHLREVFEIAAMVMARSEALMDDLEKLGCPKQKLRLLRTGLPLDDLPAPSQRTSPNAGEWQLLQACRMVEKKGLFVTLDAFSQVAAEFPRSALTLAGDGPLESLLKSRAKELGLSERVRFPGFLSQEALRSEFAAAHIFLHPSQVAADGNREGVPNALLEAMAAELPVIATRHGGIPEAVGEGVSGRLFKEGDAPGIAGALRTYFNQPETMLSAGRAARRAVEQGFSQAHQIQALSLNYREVLRSSPILG
ncbi:MAG: colanic acid/amylovoran biosynthesis glycosyltransferase [Verrucomicrobiales bacterium]|jgi:colanic acid/amylovoran biosynthesis glycosyltransferase